MRRVIALVLTIVMVFSLTSCMSNESKKKKEEPKLTHTQPYAQYVCSGCEEDDNSHAYEYLVAWLKENGTNVNGDRAFSLAVTEDSLTNLAIVYDSSEDYVYICSSAEIDGSTHTLMIALDNYSFGFSVDEDEILGILAASKYTRYEGDLDILTSNCLTLESDECVTFAKAEIAILLDGLIEFLADKTWGITIADLGFLSYENKSAQS